MPTPYNVPEKGYDLQKAVPGIEEDYYESVFKQIDLLTTDSKENIPKEDYEKKQFEVANIIYLIYEMMIDVPRELDYPKLRILACEWKKTIRFLVADDLFIYKKDFSLEAFDKWINR